MYVTVNFGPTGYFKTLKGHKKVYLAWGKFAKILENKNLQLDFGIKDTFYFFSFFLMPLQ